MLYPCEIKDFSPQPALTMRSRTSMEKLPEVIEKSFIAIAQYIASIGESISGARFVTYYSMDMNNLDIKVGFPVSKPLHGNGEIQPGKSPGGKAATCLYTGDYNKMTPAYNELIQFIKDQEYESTGTVYEVYIDPPETPQEKTRTLILFLLKT